MQKEILRTVLYNKLTKEQQNQYSGGVEFALNNDEIMTDQEVLKLLNISKRTLYTWRKNGFISFFKIRSRYYYLKTLLLIDFLKIYNDK